MKGTLKSINSNLGWIAVWLFLILLSSFNPSKSKVNVIIDDCGNSSITQNK